VPLNIPQIRAYILSVDANRNLDKYVQSKAPWFYEECLAAPISHMFSGHLHFPGDIHVDGKHMVMLGMSIDNRRKQQARASACIVELSPSSSVHVRRIQLEDA
jgi:predicted NAD/FAD-dependent oxidoreductase